MPRAKNAARKHSKSITPDVLRVEPSTSSEAVANDGVVVPTSNERPSKRPKRHVNTELAASTDPGPSSLVTEPHRREFRSPPPRKPFRSDKEQAFTPGTPSEEYMRLTQIDTIKKKNAKRKKLLILDLNGTLVYRDKQALDGPKSMPRPYLSLFLSWIFHEKSGIETMVWSSARPTNVEAMIQNSFGPHADRLKAVWARDTLGLSNRDYNRKVQTVKNLERIWSTTTLNAYYGNTILLDDSVLKAHLQPYNHVVIREFTRKDAFSKSAPDETLLAVVGVLSEAVKHRNVAYWIRHDGLNHPTEPLQMTEAPEEHSGAAPASIRDAAEDHSSEDDANPATEAEMLKDVEQKTQHWYEVPSIFAEWVERGRRELEKLDISPSSRAEESNGP